MNLVPEKFKLIPASYKGNDFIKTQYVDKDLTRKITGEFHIFETKSFGLRQMITQSLKKKKQELAGFQNE